MPALGYFIGSFIALYLLVCFVFPRQILGMMVIGNTEAEAILDVGEEYMRLMGFMGIPFGFQKGGALRAKRR